VRASLIPQEFADAYDGARTQGYFHWALAVDDLEASLDSLLNAGATLVSAPADARRRGFRFVYLKDKAVKLRVGQRCQDVDADGRFVGAAVDAEALVGVARERALDGPGADP
jgi:glyoxalase superfamily protein